MTRKRTLPSATPSITDDRHHKWRGTPAGILCAVDKDGPIQPDTLQRLLSLIREKTDFHHHVAVEVQTGAVLKTIDNEHDAQETIRRLDSLPSKHMAPPRGNEAP